MSGKFFEPDGRRALLARVFRNIFLDDWTMKLIALVITFALWLGVSGLRAPKTERLRNVALNLRVSNDVEITNSPITEIDIVVTGDDRKISQINKENLIVSLDLTETQAGDRSVQITPDNISIELPTGIKVLEIQPDKIAVKLERVEEREIPVKVETEGSPAEGFEVYSEAIVPQKVRIRAPESYVKSLNFISTEKINIEGRNADFIFKQVSLNVLNPNVKLLDTVVDVNLRIGEKRIERLFLVPVETENNDKIMKVVLFGARSDFEDLRSENLRAEITKTETGEPVLSVYLPPGIADKVEVREKKLIKKP